MGKARDGSEPVFAVAAAANLTKYFKAMKGGDASGDNLNFIDDAQHIINTVAGNMRSMKLEQSASVGRMP